MAVVFVAFARGRAESNVPLMLFICASSCDINRWLTRTEYGARRYVGWLTRDLQAA